MNLIHALQTGWRRSTTRRVWRWLTSWQGVRACLFGVASVTTVAVLFYAVENWRGYQAWKAYKLQWTAQGEKFDLAAFAPALVPDDQNFAATPLLRPLFVYAAGPSRRRWLDTNGLSRQAQVSAYQAANWPKDAPSVLSVEAGRLTDLTAWQQFYRGNPNYPQSPEPQSAAAVVLTALGKFDAELSELQQAATRPYAQFPVNYGEQDPYGILQPHLGVLRRLSSVVQLRAIARLEVGQVEQAFADLRLGFRLADSPQPEPLLLSHSVRLTLHGVALQIVREGLARRAWTDPQLEELVRYLGSVDLLRDYQVALRGERAAVIGALEYRRRHRTELLDFLFPYALQEQFGPLAKGMVRAIPRGWFYQNYVVLSRLYQEHALAAVDAHSRRVFPEKAKRLETELQTMRNTPYNMLARTALQGLSAVCLRTAHVQTFVDELRLACALERYRLGHGEFPESLEALVPRFFGPLPHDLITGEPLRYRRIAPDAYLLYSVGWDGKDDGGQIVWRRTRPRQPAVDRGDWVWQWPPN